MTLTNEKLVLHEPSLEEAAEVLQKGLLANFKEASCEVVQCPDLSEEPWGLSSRGLCGSPRIGEIGGVGHLVPLAKVNKVYDLKEMAKLIDLPEALIIGAGAGPHTYVGRNCEMISNLKTGNSFKNESRITKVDPASSACVLEKLPPEEAKCAIMLNFFACEGVPGSVIRVRASKRTGTKDFVGCMRKTLEDEYDSKLVGMGGTFLMKKGTAKIHVMPDFSETPLKTEQEVTKWLKFYDMKAPMIFMSVLLSRDPGIDFRVEHTHGYSATEGGHYHFDITPDDVEYEGYFNLAHTAYRIDKP